MISRAQDIAKMMGYESLDEMLEAIGDGQVVLFKVESALRFRVANWLREQAEEVGSTDVELAEQLEELSEGLEFFSELERYPADSDICQLDLPHGWPNYCDKTLVD